jgi:hypothetical protein
MKNYPSNQINRKTNFKPGFILGKRLIKHEKHLLDMQGGIKQYKESENYANHDLSGWRSTPLSQYSPLVDVEEYILGKIKKIKIIAQLHASTKSI